MEETVSTLKFASSAKKIKHIVHRNENNALRDSIMGQVHLRLSYILLCLPSTNTEGLNHGTA